MGLTKKPFGKFESIMRKMENEKARLAEANKSKEKPKNKRG